MVWTSPPAIVCLTKGLCALKSVRTSPKHILSVTDSSLTSFRWMLGGAHPEQGRPQWLWQSVLMPMQLLELAGPHPELEGPSLGNGLGLLLKGLVCSFVRELAAAPA